MIAEPQEKGEAFHYSPDIRLEFLVFFGTSGDATDGYVEARSVFLRLPEKSGAKRRDGATPAEIPTVEKETIQFLSQRLPFSNHFQDKEIPGYVALVT